MNPMNNAPAMVDEATDSNETTRAKIGIVLLIAGLVVPFILAAAPLTGNIRFFAVIAIAGFAQTAALICGVRSWGRPAGKFVTIAAGALLILLAAYVAFVLIVAEGASRGAPM